MKDIVRDAVLSGREMNLQWDFYEDAENAEEFATENTVPGRVVNLLQQAEGDRRAATIGLLAAFAARRSLACWFQYCDNIEPLRIIENVIGLWLPRFDFTPSFNDCWVIPIEPTENGKRIADCRWSDTSSASSSVAHSANYYKTQRKLDAITALSHAFIAFDVSPIARSSNFEDWLSMFAAPAALAVREMTAEEQFALADFRIPEEMRRIAESSESEK